LSRFAARLEVVSNVAIIVLAVIVAAIALRNYVFTPRASVELPQGTQLALPDVRWGQGSHTLVMVLRKDCQFCSASAEFYRRLLTESARLRVPVIAALPDELAASQEYLDGLGIAVGEVRNVSLRSLGVAATPTLVLVDAKGAVARSWVGQLGAADEAEVFRSLRR
jgi:thioredoxin-related protein